MPDAGRVQSSDTASTAPTDSNATRRETPAAAASASENETAATASATETAETAPASEIPPELPGAVRGELASAGFAVLLLVLMFAVEWFGVDRLPGRANGIQRETAENAWQALPLLRWLMLATVFVAIGAVILHATQHGHGARNDTGLLVMVFGTVTALLLIYRVLIDLPGTNEIVDQKLGAILGVACAIGIALGGHRSMIEERALARRYPSRRSRVGLAHRV